MQQMSGTLLDLILYLALVALGAFLGSRPQIQSLPMPWLGRFQTAALLLMPEKMTELADYLRQQAAAVPAALPTVAP